MRLRNPGGFFCVMEADGSHPRNITSHPSADISPAWSPVIP